MDLKDYVKNLKEAGAKRKKYREEELSNLVYDSKHILSFSGPFQYSIKNNVPLESSGLVQLQNMLKKLRKS